MNGRNRLTLHLLGLAAMLMTLSQLIYIPSVIEIRGDLGASSFQIALTIAGFTLAQAFSQLVYGPVVDRFQPKWILLGGLLLFSVSSFGIYFAHTISFIVVFRILQGLGVSAAIICGNALISDLFEGKGRDRAMTVFQMYFSVGAAAGPAAGAVMRMFFDWRVIFLVLGAWALTIIVLSLKFFPEGRNMPSFSYREALGVMRQKNLILVCLAGAGTGFVIQSYHTNIGFLFADFLGIHAAWTGFVFMAIPLGVFTGSNVSKWLLSRYSRERLLFMGHVGIAVFTGLLVLPLVLADTRQIVFAVIPLLYMNGIMLGMTFPMISATVVNWFASLRGTALSVVFFCRDLGSTVGPMVTGGMVEREGGIPAAFAVVFVVGLISLWLCRAGLRTGHRHGNHTETVESSA